jgi:hypothetical protein
MKQGEPGEQQACVARRGLGLFPHGGVDSIVNAPPSLRSRRKSRRHTTDITNKRKMATTTSAEDTLAPLFAALGLGPKALKEATLNKKVAATWEEVLKEGGVDESTTAVDPKAGTALTELVAATAKGDGNLAGKREFVVKQILEGKIKTKLQVAEAVKYCRENKDKQVDEEFVKGFERECGVGRSS